ncbi:DUF2282 domain-containing protein [Undibacterium arcticum]|uniref:DUF2282 domain-containing protein n=1 Tax=Undibacterium arcticum TaxID=1762892 RepID=A0ABV7EZG4_9BURK
MKTTDLIIRSAITSALALGLVAASQSALAAKGDMEHCAGIAKAGKNDCGSTANACAGTAKVDGDKDAWVYVPKGTCDKIAGGKVYDGKNMMKMDPEIMKKMGMKMKM